MGAIADQMEQQLRQSCVETLPLITAQMVEETKQACSRRSGELEQSIGAEDWTDEGPRFTSVIYAGRGLENPDRARYADEGTGIYGPEGVRITASGGGVLAFVWPGAGTPVTASNSSGLVFFRSVAGHPGTHFFMDPMPQRYRDAAGQLWR